MKLLFIVTNLIQLIMTYLSLKYFKESPLWLFSMKLKKRFIETMKEIAKINDRENQFSEWLRNNETNLDKLLNQNTKEQNNEEEIKTY